MQRTLIQSMIATNKKPIIAGFINLPEDFPLLIDVRLGNIYLVLTGVTDNDATKTNTGQTFLAGDEIIWNDTNWTLLGSDVIFFDDGTDVKTVNPRNINLQANGLKDNNVTVPILLGDVGNTSLDTINKTIVGSINEIFNTVSPTDEVQILYVGKGGSDLNAGKRIEQRFLTFGAAYAAAIALTPTSSNQIVIHCIDSGIYDELISATTDYIHIYAPNALLHRTALTGTTLSIRAKASFTFKEITGNSSAVIVSKVVNDNTSYLYCEKIYNNGAGGNISSNIGKLIAKISYVGNTDLGIYSPAYIDLEIDRYEGSTITLQAGSSGSLKINNLISGSINNSGDIKVYDYTDGLSLEKNIFFGGGSQSLAQVTYKTVQVTPQAYGVEAFRGFVDNIGIGDITNNITGIAGISAQSAASGTITLARGVRGGINILDSGNITNGYAITATSPYTPGAGIITNLYGVYIDAQSDANVINAYGLAQEGISDINYLMGSVGIGIKVPTNKLDVDGDIRVRGNSIKDLNNYSRFEMSSRTDIRNNIGSNFISVPASSLNIGLGGETTPETIVEITNIEPYITIHNSTEEDIEGGREGKIIFKGEQSGAEETTLALIQASHDGTLDDEKGDLIFHTNDGSDGITPTERMRIDSDGNIGIGVTDPLAFLHIAGATTGKSSLRIPAGIEPTSPAIGDIFTDITILKFFNGTVWDILNDPYTTTGIIEFDGLSINADPTKFDVGAGYGLDVDYTDPLNPEKEKTPWIAQTAITPTFLTSEVGTFLGIDKSGTIIQQVLDFDREQLSTIKRIGRLSHFNKTTITNTYDFPLTVETNLDFAAYVMARGTIKLDGAEVQENTTDLSIKITAGYYTRIGASDNRDSQNFPKSSLLTAPSFFPAWREAVTFNAELGSLTTQIDTTHYDDGSGTLATMTDGYYGNVYIYFFPYKNTQTIFQLYGHAEYTSIQSASDNAGSTDFFIPDDIKGGVLLAAISYQKGITDLTAAVANNTAIITLSDEQGVITNNFKNRATSLIPINFKTDFPPPIGGIIQLVSGNKYVLHRNINLGTDKINFPVDGTGGLSAVGGKVLTYTGTEALLNSNMGANTFFRVSTIIFNCPAGGSVFSLDGDTSARLVFESIAVINASGMGTIDNVASTIIHSSLKNIGTGLVLNDVAAFGLSETILTDWKNQSTTFVSFTGSTPSISVRDNIYDLQSNEYFIDIDSGTTLNSCSVKDNLTTGSADNFWAPGSRKQDDIYISVIDNSLVESSTISGEFFSEGNTTTFTDIPAINAFVLLDTGISFTSDSVSRLSVSADGIITYLGFATNSISIDGNINLDPQTASKNVRARFFILEKEAFITTFDNTVNRVLETATARVNGDIICYKNAAGTLPAELRKNVIYFVINKTTDSYQLSYIPGGAAISFTDDGTPINSYSLVKAHGATGRANITASNPIDLVPHALVPLRQSDQVFCAVQNATDAVNLLVRDVTYSVSK